MRSCATTTAFTLCFSGWLYSACGAIGAAESKVPAASAAPDAAAASTLAKDDPSAVSAAPAKKEYKPPYPSRTNFFEPVETAVEQALSAAQPMVHSRQTILLKGFVSFPDEPIRAVMNINNKMVQLAVGESFGGVHLVSTEPPNATVKNEEKSWTLNLMKQPDPRTAAKVTPRSFSTLHNHAASEHTAGSQAELRLLSP